MPSASTCVVTVLVGPDCLGPGLVTLLGDAHGRLEVAVYEIGPSYASLLVEAAERGTEVYLLVDDHAGPTSGALAVLRRAGAGAEVRAVGGRRGAAAHWKVIVAGSAAPVVAVGTGNLDLRDAPWRDGRRAGTREVWVVVEDHPVVAAGARQAIAAAWAAGRQVPVRLAPSTRRQAPPVGDPGTRAAPLRLEVPRTAVEITSGGAAIARLLVERLAACRRRALACVPYVHARTAVVAEVIAALSDARARGAEVRLLLGADPASDAAAASPRDLHALGVEARVLDPQRVTTGHAKVAVVDGWLLCGSANWSAAGLGGNLEAALTVADPRAADHVADVVDHDWRASS